MNTSRVLARIAERTEGVRSVFASHTFFLRRMAGWNIACANREDKKIARKQILKKFKDVGVEFKRGAKRIGVDKQRTNKFWRTNDGSGAACGNRETQIRKN